MLMKRVKTLRYSTTSQNATFDTDLEVQVATSNTGDLEATRRLGPSQRHSIPPPIDFIITSETVRTLPKIAKATPEKKRKEKVK